ncbi:NAD-P-binding protein [Trametes versicolor FP-101664 SS1]|uniref:NAD-P-binding protein n=1 Tax=Trametes versicolor (strain FP-101664) TaxID=717944 RepID=UPI00046245DD|nr:NAD-P-binding protein [Trametes versicolor FP-101664 SS1]EIW52326.1 NAD-P-binding protein [Trametes versicolor FP-101664 SS1]
MLQSPGHRVWLITGASSGFGRALCDLVLKNGESVVAAARRTHMLDDLVRQYSADRILVVRMDVTQPHDVSHVFSRAKGAFGHVDVVFNNAGYGGLGEVESVQDADARGLLETNFWGAVSVTREAVNFFRESNPSGAGGRLLQMSSMFGIAGSPCLAFYSASKHALEGFTKSIVQELDPAWNIKITILEPGFFQTEVVKVAKWSPTHPAYVKPTLPGSSMRAGWDSFVLPGDPTKAAEALYRAASIQNPPLHLVLGKDAIALAKKEAAELQDTIARFEDWSNDLELPSGKGTAYEGTASAGAHTGTGGAMSGIVPKL